MAFLEGFYYKPRIDFELLAAHAGGLIGTTACLRGTVAQAALGEGFDQAVAAALLLPRRLRRRQFLRRDAGPRPRGAEAAERNLSPAGPTTPDFR